MELAQESLFKSPAETVKLWTKHWSETEEAYRPAPMNPDWEQFHRLELAGWSRYYTLRIDGKLVGHLYYIVYKNRHTQTQTATEDFFYLLPEARKGLNAIKLIRFAVESLRAEGIKEIGMSSKLTSGRDIAPLLKRVGFRHVANYYVM